MQVKLIDLIPEDIGERNFLLSPYGTFSYSDLFSFVDVESTKLQQIKGKRVALRSTNRFLLAKYLVLIDSLVDVVFFVPDELSRSDLETMARKLSLDYEMVLSDVDVSLNTFDAQAISSGSEMEGGWLLATSGTTGTPKVVRYDLDSLLKTAKRNVEQGGAYIWAQLYDLNRFAGLQVFLQAFISGSALAIPDSDMSIKEQVSFLNHRQVNCISATPSYWRKFLMSGVQFNQLNRITLGGEISDQGILDALRASYADAKIVHIYASTELGVGFSVNDGLEGIPIKYFEDGELPGIALKIVDEHLWIKSERKMKSMMLGAINSDDFGFYDTGDIVEATEKRVKFLGRASGSINVGGNKVMPEEIESVILSMDGVVSARVYAKKSSVLGALVSVDVVRSSQDSVSKKDVIDKCRGALPAYKIPAVVKFVNSIELGSTGKVVRRNV